MTASAARTDSQTDPDSFPGLFVGRAFCRLLGWLLLLLGTAAPLRAGLSVSTNGVLLLDGRPYRGFGVNGYDLFARTLSDASTTNQLDAFFLPLARRGIPFVRFAACGYWPNDWGLFQTNRSAHFARMDAVVEAARRHRIGLIPSFFWHGPTLSDLAGEPFSAWGSTNSATHGRMHEYTSEMVRRYRDNPAIWAWEFGNEHNLPADLPNAADHRPSVAPSLGTPEKRTAADEISLEQFRTGLKAFAEEVRRLDPTRALLSGNAFPRISAWHQEHGRTWTRDTPEQFAKAFAADHPGPVDVLSGRLYEESDLSRLGLAMAASRNLRKPLFVGEFGVPGPLTSETRRRFQEMLAHLESEQVPLAAFWVYGYPGQEADWNITDTNGRAALLDDLAAAHRRLRGGGKGR